MIKILINDAFKKYLMQQPPEYRNKVRQKFEFLEIGYWDGGLQVKKIKSIGGNKVVFEARLDKANRILFTLGTENGNGEASPDLLIYVWGIVSHDDVANKSRNIFPVNVPFLQFKEYREEDLEGAQLDALQKQYYTQEGITQKIADDSSTQKWHFLDDENWQRISQYRQADFEMRLYLTPEQKAVQQKALPVLISGTAGSGKTTISVYELLQLPLAKKKKLFITYNHYLKNTAQQLYNGLLNEDPLKDEFLQPDFFAFKEFCLKVANTWHRKFPQEKEVALERFNKLILKNSHAKRFDAPLIWEEIRSIIKGALPQINVEVLKKAHAGLKNRALPPVLLNALQQQFLTFAQLKSLEKVEKFTQKYLHTGLETFAKNLGDFVERDSDRVLAAVERVIDLLRKERELTQKKYLSFPDYEALGKKKAPNFQLDRKSIYRIFEWYQCELESQGLWDELDLTRETINLLSQHDSDTHRYDIVVCDEVQDLTDVQHELLFYVVRHPVNLLLCGDTKQIINPSGFRWEEVKRHFYVRNLPIPEICYLNLNFRSSGSIVELSNILLDLKASLLGSRAEEQKEEWKYKGRPPVVVQNLNPPAMLENIRRTGARKTILVRTEEEKNALQKLLDTELVFTINEAKGLEFDTVLLWKFASEARTTDVWKTVLRESNKEIHQAQIRHEINLLYVAITRAQRDLLIYDGPQASLIWQSEPIRDKIYVTDDADYIATIWDVISTPEEWLEQGHYFFEHAHYKAAMECYKNAGQDALVFKARAFAAEKRGDSRIAAVSFEKLGEMEKAAAHYEASGNDEKAHRLWKALKNEENALRCYLKVLEKQGKYAELAKVYVSRKDFQKALGYFSRAGDFEKAAEISLKQFHKKEDAAKYFEKAGAYEKAAALQKKLRNLETAAELYEKAKHFAEAKKLWKQLKRTNRLISLLEREGDYASLLKIHEKNRDFDNAVKALRRMPGKESLLDEALELYEKRRYFPALIRYYVANAKLSTANCYLKLRKFSEAGRHFVHAREYYEAGEAYRKAKDHENALINYLKSDRDKQNDFADAKRVARHVPKPAIHKLGNTLFSQKKYPQAACCFDFVEDNALAGACHLEIQQSEKAFSYWQKCLRDESELDDIARYCITHHKMKEGARFILEQPPRNFMPQYYFYWEQPQMPELLLNMMDRYFEDHPDEQEMLKWVEMLKRLEAFETIPEKRLFYIEKGGDNNQYFDYLRYLSYHEKDIFKIIKNKFRREYRLFANEMTGFAATKLYFMGKYDEYNRAVSKLQLTEKNYLVFVESDQAEKTIDFLIKDRRLDTVKMILIDRNEFLRLAQIYEKYGIPDSAAHYYGVAGKLEKSATLFVKIEKFHKAGEAYYKMGDYQKAIEMYKRTGRNKTKIAQIHEKLGNWEEALKIWKELGKKKKVQRCLGKLGRQAELDL